MTPLLGTYCHYSCNSVIIQYIYLKSALVLLFNGPAGPVVGLMTEKGILKGALADQFDGYAARPAPGPGQAFENHPPDHP